MTESNATWKNGMLFHIDLQGYAVPVDSTAEYGGQGLGPQPKGLMLSALAGCTGMDVVSLLGKMKVPFDSFSIDTHGEPAETHPKVFTSVLIRYHFTGKNLVEKKILQSIDLSLNNYCAVAATLSKTAKIRYELWLNGKQHYKF